MDFTAEIRREYIAEPAIEGFTDVEVYEASVGELYARRCTAPAGRFFHGDPPCGESTAGRQIVYVAPKPRCSQCRALGISAPPRTQTFCGHKKRWRMTSAPKMTNRKHGDVPSRNSATRRAFACGLCPLGRYRTLLLSNACGGWE